MPRAYISESISESKKESLRENKNGSQAQLIRTHTEQKSLDTWVDGIYMRHPAKKRKNKTLMEEWAIKRWTAEEEAGKDPNALFAEIDRVHRLCCETEDWIKETSHYCPLLIGRDTKFDGHLFGWLPDEGWREEPVRNKASPTSDDEAKYQRALAEEKYYWDLYHKEEPEGEHEQV